MNYIVIAVSLFEAYRAALYVNFFLFVSLAAV